MNDILLDTESEDLDLLGYGEEIDDYDGEGIEEAGEGGAEEDYYGEEPELAERRSPAYYRALARARARARARALARARYRRPMVPATRRRYLARTSRVVPTTRQVGKGFDRVSTDVQKTRAAVQKVDLNNKVQSDILGSALKAQRDRIGRNEYAQAASKVVDKLREAFPTIADSSILKHGLPLLPLLALKPHKRGTGIESLISDPRWLGLAIGGALGWYIERQGEKKVAVVTLDHANVNIPAGKAYLLRATALDSSGKVISAPSLSWTSADDTIASVANGYVEAKAGKGGNSVKITVKENKTGSEATAIVNIS